MCFLKSPQCADINIHDKEERTPLIWAAYHGYRYIVALLLERGANPNLRSKSGDTAYDWANARGHTHIAAMLKKAMEDRGDDLDLHPTEEAQDTQTQQEAQAEENTALTEEDKLRRDRVLISDIIRRIENKNIFTGELRDFVESGIDLNLLVRDKNGLPRSLLKAVVVNTEKQGQDMAIEIIDLMLANGADIDIRCGHSSATPLMSAANLSCTTRSLKKVVESLIKRGANLHLKNSRGQSVCELASYSICDETFKVVLRALGKDSQEVLDLVDDDRRERARDLLAEEDFRQVSIKYSLEIQRLVEQGNLQAVRDLLAEEDFRKDYLKVKNAAGHMPFDVAVENKHFGIAAVLLREMKGINKRDPQGWTPLNYALLANDRGLIREFIRDGAVPTVGRGHYGGQTAFDLTEEFDQVEGMNMTEMLVEILQEEGKLDYDKNGWYDAPLHWAVEHKKTNLVGLLLDAGADPFHENGYGNNALDNAKRYGGKKIEKLLRQKMYGEESGSD